MARIEIITFLISSFASSQLVGLPSIEALELEEALLHHAMVESKLDRQRAISQ
jgi:hypothetical protein